MRQLFVNGPIQNGEFNFDTRPGAAAGLHIADTFNELASGETAPDLWNTVTLKGDLLFADAGTDQDRAAFEAGRITRKYRESSLRENAFMTDADPEVADLALELVDHGLRKNTLRISDEVVRVCRGCAHMVGGAAACKACGGEDIATETQRHLVFDRDTSVPVLTPDGTYARVNMRSLATEGGHVPETLILSKTRSYGIELGAIGLNGLVLDPRAGLHVTALAAGRRYNAETTSMVITPKAASGLLAYGMPFRSTDTQNLTYALHGYVPYGTIDEIAKTAPPEQADAVRLFADTYMPVNAMASPREIAGEQAMALYKFFGKVLRLELPDDARAELREQVRDQINGGNLRWITDKRMLAAALQPQPTENEPDPDRRTSVTLAPGMSKNRSDYVIPVPIDPSAIDPTTIEANKIEGSGVKSPEIQIPELAREYSTSLYAIFGDRIQSLLFYGSHANRERTRTETSDYDFCLVLDDPHAQDFIWLRQLGIIYDRTDVTVHYLTELETRGWENFQLGNHGVFALQYLATANAILGENVFRDKVPLLNPEEVARSLRFQVGEYLWRIDNWFLTLPDVNQLGPKVWKYLLRISHDMQVWQGDLSFEQVGAMSNAEYLGNHIVDRPYFSDRTKELFEACATCPNLPHLSELRQSLGRDFITLEQGLAPIGPTQQRKAA